MIVRSTNQEAMSEHPKMITSSEVRELLSYDPATGEFRWRRSRRGLFAGTVAGNTRAPGYRVIMIDGRTYYAHRLAWLYVHGGWPAYDVDHIDGDKDNNAISNLRQATVSENIRNRGKLSTNTSGVKGVCWNKKLGKWQASITLHRKQISLGYFDSIDDAARAYADAAYRLHGEFANIGRASPPTSSSTGSRTP